MANIHQHVSRTESEYAYPDLYTDLRPVSEHYKRYDDLKSLTATTEKKKTRTIWIILILVLFIVCVSSAAVTYIAVYYLKESVYRSLCSVKKCGPGSCYLSSDAKAFCICPEGRTGDSCEILEFHVSEIRTSCPSNWTAYENHCYKEIKDRMTWYQSKNLCRSMGADLLSIHDQQETEFLVRTFPLDQEKFWIGLINYKQNNGIVNWIDGTTSRYTHWNSGEPNNLNNNEHCVQLFPQSNGSWNDNNCYMSLKSICKQNRTSLCDSDSWEYFNGSCYIFVSEDIQKMGWTDARRMCQAGGADLVNIQSKNEYHFLLSQITKLGFGSLWIGLNDRLKKDDYRWSDGSVPTFLSWNIEEPDGFNEHCVAMSARYGNWADETCETLLGHICEQRVS